MSEIAQAAKGCLQWLLEGMGVDAQIEVLCREGQIILDVACDEDSSVAIGRKGQTLEALQLLVNRIVARRHPEVTASTRILVDVEGYRERRRHNLIDMAQRTAQEVCERGEAISLAPLNSYERFLVHNALKDEPGVETSSTGEGEKKQILISPTGSEGP